MVKVVGVRVSLVVLVIELSRFYVLVSAMTQAQYIGTGLALAAGGSYLLSQKKLSQKKTEVEHPLFNYTDRDCALIILAYAQQPPYWFKGTCCERYKTMFAESFLEQMGAVACMLDGVRWGLDTYLGLNGAIDSYFPRYLPQSSFFWLVRRCMCEIEETMSDNNKQRVCDLDDTTQEKVHGLIRTLRVNMEKFLICSEGALFWYGGVYRPYKTILDESDLTFLNNLYIGTDEENLPGTDIQLPNCFVYYANSTKNIVKIARRINSVLQENSY
ncbi:MAG: hypothetical protein WBQ73_00140 [Candidatus Babeliales bacterium]